ncbi:MAG: amino acid racemase [Bacteroidales bacterium]|nr:amino acid racemase [Bacteroidales bacterium]MCM1415782.1 amino acid racemase [bacterium]MCM1422724.1 amino acid racemase [bacterium]
MKKLGLVGGMGPESTIPYYHDIVYGVQNRVGNDFFPSLAIESVNVFDVLRLCDEQKYDELTDYLMRAIKNLIAGGADFIALSANTPHIVFDRLQERSTVPLISIVEAACKEAIRLNKRKVGLLGTIFTMTEDFFKKPFYNSHIEVVIPTVAEMEYINSKISSELERGIIKEETLQGFQKIIRRMQRDDCIEAVILGCTELPLLLNDEVSPVSCLDTMKIHIRLLIDLIVEDLLLP